MYPLYQPKRRFGKEEEKGMKCDTRYPVVLIHGCNLRDFKPFGYWGRIPYALRRHGARVYFGGQDAWGTIEHNAGQLKNTVERILQETGCGKVNLIAHSKGGLEARYLITHLGMEEKIASLTTISTPHHGMRTVDWLSHLPRVMQVWVMLFENAKCRLYGDEAPNFYRAYRQLSQSYCRWFNQVTPDSPLVYYQSYGSRMRFFWSDMSLLLTGLIMACGDGKNDGLVSEASCRWGNFRGMLESKTRRGISHQDMVDFRRKNIQDFDICQFYITLVQELKEMGF